MKLVPPRILKQLLQENHPLRNHHHTPNIPPRLMKLQQQQPLTSKRFVPPRLQKLKREEQQLITIRRSNLMTQDPMGMAILPHPQYLDQPMTVHRHSPLPSPLFLHRHLIVHQYLVPRPGFNLQRQDQEQEPDRVQETLPHSHDESSVVDYARLTSFLDDHDDSILTPWNWNPDCGHSASTDKHLQTENGGSFFSFNVQQKWGQS